MEPIADTNHQSRLRKDESVTPDSTIDAIPEEAIPYAKGLCKITIQLNGKSTSGSGFLCEFQLESVGHVIGMFTNHHVLNQKKNYSMTREKYDYAITKVEVEKFCTNADIDVTFVTFNEKFLKQLRDDGWYFFKVSDDEIAFGSSVLILHHPRGGDASFSMGKATICSEDTQHHSEPLVSDSTIETTSNEKNEVCEPPFPQYPEEEEVSGPTRKVTPYSNDTLYYTASTLKGSSGSPLLDENYRVIGIHKKGSYSGNDAISGPYNIGTSIKCAIDFIKNSPEFGGNSDHAKWMHLPVGDLSLRPPMTVVPEITVNDTLVLLDKEKVDQIPVVNEKNQMIGMVTVGQLMSALVKGKIRSSDPVSEAIDMKFNKVNIDTTLETLSGQLDLDNFVVVVHNQRQIGKDSAETNKEIIIGIVTRIDLALFLARF